MGGAATTDTGTGCASSFTIWVWTGLEAPFDEAAFGLFEMEADPGETTDLARTEPAQFATMLRLWREQRVALGIILPGDL